LMNVDLGGKSFLSPLSPQNPVVGKVLPFLQMLSSMPLDVYWMNSKNLPHSAPDCFFVVRIGFPLYDTPLEHWIHLVLQRKKSASSDL